MFLFGIGLVQDFISPSLYDLKAPYHMEAEGIVVHNTYNDASARNERAYVISNPKSTSYHIAVDDKEAIQLIPFDRNAYHCGSSEGNRNYIGLEICYSKSGGDKFEQSENNAVDIVADILIDKNWTIDNVKFHKDFANKNCPHRTVPSEFIEEVSEEIASRGYRIINKPTATLKQIEDWAKRKNASELYIDLLPVMYETSKKYGVDPVVTSVQCALETGYLKKGNSQSGGHNPAGIKSSKDTNRYATYDSWEDGIDAQVKLLAKYSGAYGSSNSWLYGKCKTVEGLANLWAENPNYSNMLLSMINDIEKTYTYETQANEPIKKEESLVNTLKNKIKRKFSFGKNKVDDILSR